MLSRPVFATRSFRNLVLIQNYYARTYVSGSEGPNHAIIDMLKRNMEEEEKSENRNGYKVRAFSTAIKVISQLDHPISSVDQAQKLKGIGVGITRRIQEFLDGNEYSFISDSPEVRLQETARRKIRSALELVPGIGLAKAHELMDAGCTKPSDLHLPQYYSMLTASQQVEVKYFEHLRQPVLREETEEVTQFIRDNISSKFEIILTGSYRRRAPASSDIHIMLLHPDHVHIPIPTAPSPFSEKSRRGRVVKPFRAAYLTTIGRNLSLLLHDVVPTLEDRGLIAASLSTGTQRWQGVVRLPEKDQDGMWSRRQQRLGAIEKNKGIYRRMDLNLVPLKSKGAALLALTGDLEFNRHIRSKAVKLGMHLNEFGLWRWNTNNKIPSREQEDEVVEARGFWELVRAETEEEILKELGMEYVEPEKRNFLFVVGKPQLKGRARKA